MIEIALATLGKAQVILIDGKPASAQEIYKLLIEIESGKEFEVQPIRAGTWSI